MKSIIQKDESECFLCGRHDCLEEHHIFGGSSRKFSERYGLKVKLCHWCHNEPPNGVHHDKEARLYLQKIGQEAFLREHGSREDFFRIFGRFYD